MVLVSFYFLVIVAALFSVFSMLFDLETRHKLGVFLLITGSASIYSLLTNYQYVFFASFISFIMVVLAYLWSENIFTRFNIKRGLSKDKIFIGEEVNFELEIENKKLLPIPKITVKDYVTDGIEFVNENFFASVPGTKANIFNDKFSLRWYEKVKKSYQLKTRQRGYYKFGEGDIFYQGIFGLFKNQISMNKYTELIVFPRILSAKKLGLEFRQLFGSKLSEGWIHKDPLNKVGVRPYQTTDNIKKINWKASARHNKIESDIYKPSYDREVHIFLSNNTTRDWWDGIIRNRLELAIIYAASLVNYGINQGYQVGLYSDGLIKNSSRYISVSPGQSSSHKDKLLTTLAMLKAASQVKFSKILYQEKNNIRPGSTVIIISSFLSAETERMINIYKNNYDLHLIKIGKNEKETKIPGVNTYFIDEEEKLDEIQQMKYNG